MSSNTSSTSTSSDSKKQMIGRNFVAFLLFISIVAFSLSVCAKACFLNSERYAEIFTNQNYVDSLYNDIKQYAYDICEDSSIPTSCVDEVITYTSIYNIEEAYALGNLTSVEQYTQTTYDDRISQLKESLVESTTDMIKSYNIKTDKGRFEGVNEFALKISEYIRSTVEFEFMDKLETIANLGKTISVVMIVVFAILTIGNRNYRGLRAIAYSFISSAVLQFGFVVAMQIIKQCKTLVIYPTYLCESVMSFVNSSILCVVISASISFGISLIIATTVWKLKRYEQ
jgi:hypothetical protein